MPKHAAKWRLLPTVRAGLCAIALLAAALIAGCGGGGSSSEPRVSHGTLIISSTPSGARILIDDQDTGKTTPQEITREVQQDGTQFRITARLAGYEDAHATVMVRPNEAVPVSLTLKQTRPPAVPPHTITGKVQLQTGGGTVAATNPTVTATETTTNESFTASLDAAPERAGTYYIYAPPGQYRVTASMPGYQAQTRDVTIVSGDDRRTGVDFTLPPG